MKSRIKEGVILAVLWLSILSIVVAVGSGGYAHAKTDTTYGYYVPLYVPKTGTIFNDSATPIISLTYVKQADQVTFRACANLVGDGTWALTYPEVGDPISFHYATYTWACIDTVTGAGGGTIGQNLQLWLYQGAGNTAHMQTPNVFVSSGN